MTISTLHSPLRISVLLLSLFFHLASAKEAQVPIPHPLVGEWSAPSLSQPNVPILITLTADGIAKEQIGTYQSQGTWQSEGSAIRIRWAGGWIGLLRPKSDKSFELLTWKAGTPSTNPPDDAQPAQRVSP